MGKKKQARFVMDWVDRLLSGDYVQGTSYLRYLNPDTGQEYNCCLGVAADGVEGAEWMPSDEGGDEDHGPVLAVKFPEMVGTCSTSLTNFNDLTGLEFDGLYGDTSDPDRTAWVGHPGYREEGFQDLLVQLNDTESFTFEQIAKVLNKRAKQVFGKGWRKKYARKGK